jgi:DNA repair exonuclease SbcCD nuclease subunit
MPIRILHTADNHIGITFRQYPPDIQQRLIKERFDSLERIINIANQRKAHFVTISGDLFDKVAVKTEDIRKTVDILSRFEGEAVLVLAGNHDYCEGNESKLWKVFSQSINNAGIVPLLKPQAEEFTVDDITVVFYPCPCPTKYSAEPVIGWVKDIAKSPEKLHIGLAHGNVEGRALDDNQRYFNMTEEALRAAKVDTWLLGHIHAPFPEPGSTGKPLYFMPGIPTPDSVKVTRPGQAWWIELELGGNCCYEPVQTDGIRFVRMKLELQNQGDLQRLKTECANLDAPNTVLDLIVNGRLSSEDQELFREFVTEISSCFLHVSVDQEIATLLTPAEIASRFAGGTLPNELLQALLADASHPNDAHIALEIIESLNNK